MPWKVENFCTIFSQGVIFYLKEIVYAKYRSLKEHTWRTMITDSENRRIFGELSRKNGAERWRNNEI